MPRQPSVPTRHIRVAADLADKLGEILDVEDDTNSAEWVDPLIRREIENRHKQYMPAILKKREAHEQAKKLRDEPPAMQNTLTPAEG